MMRGKHIWTPEEIEKLREFYATTRPAAELATELGVTVRSVYDKAQSLGLKKPEMYRSIAGKKGTQSPLAIAHRFRRRTG